MVAPFITPAQGTFLVVLLPTSPFLYYFARTTNWRRTLFILWYLRKNVGELVFLFCALIYAVGIQMFLPLLFIIMFQVLVARWFKRSKRMIGLWDEESRRHLDLVEQRVQRMVEEEEDDDDEDEDEDEYDEEDDEPEQDEEEGEDEDTILEREERAKHRATRNLLLQITLPMTIGIMYLNGWREVHYLLQREEAMRALLQRAVQWACPPLYNFVTRTLGVKAVAASTASSAPIAVPSAVFDKMHITA